VIDPDGSPSSSTIAEPPVADPPVAEPPVAEPAVAGPSVAATVIDLIEQQVRRTPDHRAVIDDVESWTYQQLWDRAGSVAARLAAVGVGPTYAVGLCVPRTNAALAAILGTLRSGAAYVPLDPTYPAERLRAMCSRVALSLVVGPPALTAALPADILTLDLDGLIADGRPFDGPGPGADDRAYVLFTSGSSGVPKGVEVCHANVMALLDWIRASFTADEMALVVGSTSFNFDPSLIELFGPLLCGGALRLLPNALAVADLDEPFTLLSTPPSVASELVRARRFPPTVRTLLVGGEVLPPSLATELLSTGLVTRLVNCYGPTETTVAVTAAEVRLPVEASISIGHELPGTTILLLDDDGQPVADGDIGHLWITGPQVARGYVNDPALTQTRFVQAADGVRRYRSGDLGRRRPDGSLEFQGRSDQQMKVRGFRVEPGDVERALDAQPGVVRSAVTTLGHGSDARLVAFYVAAGDPPSSAALRHGLRQVLPGYLVPARYEALEHLPLTVTGKLDRRALADLATPPDAIAATAHDRRAAHPGGMWADPEPTITHPTGADLVDPVAATVARLAAEVLNHPGPISPDDDFLDDLGGSSLAMIHLLSRLEDAFLCRLPVGRVLADTTIAGLAALVAGRTAADDDVLLVNPDGSRAPLFLLHAYLGSVLRYRRVGPALSPDQPLVGIHVHDLEGDTTSRVTIEDLADRAIERIRTFRPHGPYLLGGHSAGGLVAYEAARKLVAQGETVTRVVLIDSPARVSLPHYYWGELVLNWPELRSAPPRRWAVAGRAMVASRLSLRGRARAADGVDMAVERAGRLSNLAVRNHVTAPYGGDVVVLHTRQGVQMAMNNQTLGWDRYVSGRITSRAIPGGHTTLFDPPHLTVVANVLATVLDALDELDDPTPASSPAARPEATSA
jgi:amino acid adenylation domain-containing protein